MRERPRHIVTNAVSKLAKHDVGTVGPQHIMAASKLLEISERIDCWELRRRAHMVGLTRFGAVTVVVPPSMPTRTFLGLIYLLDDIPLDEVGAVDLDLGQHSSELFQAAIAAGLVRAVDNVARMHIDQSYETHRERLQLLRGKPIWKSEIGRVRDGSIVCEFALKTTDGLLNQLLLGGLLEARKHFEATETPASFRRHVVAWRALATPLHKFERHDFVDANRRLTRQNQAYGPALRLCEALLLGVGIPDSDFEGQLALPVFNLWPMFEKLVARVVAAIADALGFTVDTQPRFRHFLSDAAGEDYREFRPDIVIKNQAGPSAVLDAKYKPRYVRLNPLRETSHRISTADMYQLFFYADRLRQQSGLKDPIKACIAAPRYDDGTEMPSKAQRTIRWNEAGTDQTAELRVIPIPVVPIIDAFIQGESCLDAARHATELCDALGLGGIRTAAIGA